MTGRISEDATVAYRGDLLVPAIDKTALAGSQNVNIAMVDIGMAPPVQSPTGHFYTSDGAVINYVADRLLVGGAVHQDGNSSSTAKTWLGASAGGVNLYMDTTSQMETLLLPGGAVAAAFGARSQDATSFDGVFALTAHGSNDHGTADKQAWGIYTSAVRVTAHGTYTAGIESDVTTLQAQVVSSAYNTVPSGMTTAMSLMAGGETALAASGLTVNPTSSAMIIATAGTGANLADPVGYAGACFRKGILFQSNAIAGTDGNTGSWGTAIEFCKGHAIVWRNDVTDNDIGGMIRSDNQAKTYQTRVVFAGTQFQIKGVQADLVTETVLFGVNPLPGAVVANAPVVSGAVASSPVIYTCQGSDTNIDLYLAPKGTGLVRLGNRGSTAASVAANFVADHYIPIKDAGGNIRYVPSMNSGW